MGWIPAGFICFLDYAEGDGKKVIFGAEAYQNALHPRLPLHRGALGAVSAKTFFETLKGAVKKVPSRK